MHFQPWTNKGVIPRCLMRHPEDCQAGPARLPPDKSTDAICRMRSPRDGSGGTTGVVRSDHPTDPSKSIGIPCGVAPTRRVPRSY